MTRRIEQDPPLVRPRLNRRLSRPDSDRGPLPGIQFTSPAGASDLRLVSAEQSGAAALLCYEKAGQ